MRNIIMKDRNFTGELIVFVQKKNTSFYCLTEVEYMIGEYWNSYIDLSKTTIEEGYFEYLKQFQINYYSLCEEFELIVKDSDEFDLHGNLPKIVIDFDSKIFVSFFQEQELERRVPKGWVGENKKIGSLIPNKFKYWEPFESEWI